MAEQYDDTSLGLKLPWPGNPAVTDAQRIRESLQTANTLIAALQTSDTGFAAALATEITNRNAAITAAIDALIGGAPGTLNTLDELAAALADDASYAATIVAALAGKAASVHDHDSRYYTEAEVDALILPISTGWAQIGSTVTISSPAASVDFTSGLTTHRELIIEIAGVTHNSGSSQFLQMALSQNAGSSWGTAFNISSSLTSVNVVSGLMRVNGRDRDFSTANGGVGAAFAELAALSTGSPILALRHTGGFNGLRLTVSGGALSAGTVKLFGR